ncbi:hypothetical protein R1flu_007910 [Riccia fluitans]|uniref:Uncharacterized protein n=1 Tax=Riccia fluitans TaxID=41844 RepID=A0ABD1Z092_9MARC
MPETSCGMRLSPSQAVKQQRRESKWSKGCGFETHLTLQPDRANKAREEPPSPGSKHRKQWQRPSTNSGIPTIQANRNRGMRLN